MAPRASKARNRSRVVPDAPAKGAATASSPCTNFETRSDFTPCRTKDWFALCTQELGSSENPQAKCRILLPHLRPASNQARSADRKARTDRTTMAPKFSFPELPAHRRLGGPDSPVPANRLDA